MRHENLNTEKQEGSSMTPHIFYKEVEQMAELEIVLNEFFENGKSMRQVMHLIHGFAPLTGRPFLSIIYIEPVRPSGLIGVVPSGRN